MQYRILFLALGLLAGCSDAEDEPQVNVAADLCKAAVEMTSQDPKSVKWMSVFDASSTSDAQAKEARMRIPASVEHVVGVTFNSTVNGHHHEGKAFCGFSGPLTALHIEHILVDGRELDTFSMDEVRQRFEHKDVEHGGRI